jgi:hypothetical protein
MTIDFITPKPKSTLAAGASISFTVANSYTQMDIQADGESVYTTAGGPQSGYTVKVVESGSNHVYTITKDAGWDALVTLIQVTSNEDTDVTVTVFSYDQENPFPKVTNPRHTSDFAKLKISQDDGTPIEDVTQIDLVTGTPPDGLNAQGSVTPTAQIEATAATTDPDALHDNEANEISALTTKGIDSTTPLDWVIIEDEEDSYNKKRMRVDNFVGYGSPKKMENDFSCQFLYKFNNNYNNDGAHTASAANPLLRGFTQCRRIMFDDKIGGEEGRHFQNDSSAIASSWSLTDGSFTDASAIGECTVQWLGTIGGDGADFRDVNNGYTLFGLKGQNRVSEKISWALFLHNDGVNRNYYYPKFIYSNATDTANYEIFDSSFVLQEMNRYHIVGRRQDDGLGTGTYNASLWVNGLKVAETTGLPVAWTAVSGGSRIVHGAETGAEGLERIQVFCTKMSNTALTDAQINSEYKKALGYV